MCRVPDLPRIEQRKGLTSSSQGFRLSSEPGYSSRYFFFFFPLRYDMKKMGLTTLLFEFFFLLDMIPRKWVQQPFSF